MPKLIAVAAALVLAATGCSGDDDDTVGKIATTTTAVAQADLPDVELDVIRAELISPHQALGPLDDATRDRVVDVVERLLLATSAAPLAIGKTGGGFADLFTPDAGARAANADRSVLFDEGVPRFGALRPVAGTVDLRGLADFAGPEAALVVATFDWTVESTERAGDRVQRRGELSLIPDGDDWRIGAYTIAVTRTIGSSSTTTTAATP